MEHLLNPKNLNEALENKKEILKVLSQLQKKIETFPEYKEPKQNELSKKIFNKSFNDLIIDDIIVINRMLNYKKIFNVFF
jgi:hypothetical protein